MIDRLESLIVGVILGSALLLVVVTIVLRYLTPQYATQITDEVTVYMVMWAVLLACGASRRGEHVKADEPFVREDVTVQEALDRYAGQ